MPENCSNAKIEQHLVERMNSSPKNLLLPTTNCNRYVAIDPESQPLLHKESQLAWQNCYPANCTLFSTASDTDSQGVKNEVTMEINLPIFIRC